MTLRLDRLTLRLSGISEPEGRRLARLVGEGLATAASITGSDVPALRVALAARPGEPLEATANRIVAELVRALEAP